MKKQPLIKITKPAVKQFWAFLGVFLIGLLVAVGLVAIFVGQQIIDNQNKILRYMERAFDVSPDDVADLSREIKKLPWVEPGEANLYALRIYIESHKNEVDPWLIYSLILKESLFKIDAMSSANCLGLCQLNPKVFSEYTIQQLRNPRLNIELGVKHFAGCKKRARGDKALAVRLYHGDPLDPGSIKLSKRVMRTYWEMI